MVTDPLSVEKIPPFTLITYNELESTSDYLKAHADSFLDKTIITAVSQTKGRGQFGRTWHSPEGGLYFSLLLKNNPADLSAYNLTQIISVCLADSIKSLGLNPVIKWPNDILIDNRKLSGVLSETIQLNNKEVFIIGAGVNLNLDSDQISSIEKPAISMSGLLKKETRAAEFLKDLVPRINSRLSEDFPKTRESWLSYSRLEGRRVEVYNIKDNSLLSKGRVLHLTEKGGLLIQSTDGEEVIFSGELKIIQ